MEKFKKKSVSRTTIIFFVLIFFFTLGSSRLFYLQIIRGNEYAEKAQNQQLSDKEIEAKRGAIYDSQGNVLAQSATVYNIFIDPSVLQKEGNEDMRYPLVEILAKALDMDAEEKEELLQTTYKDTKYAVIARRVEYNVRKEITEAITGEEYKKLRLGSAIGYEETTNRYYPYSTLASPVLGFVGSDNQGLEGIEAYYDEELSGVNGRIITVTDAVSKSISDEFETIIPAQDGNSLVLTLNSSIQHVLERELQDALEEYNAKGTYGVVMDCNTGAVLAMASLPGYDCNNPRTVIYDEYLKDIAAETDSDKKAELESTYIQKQWRNFTVADTYLTGSVYKVYMSAAGLEEGVVNLTTTYNCTGVIRVATEDMHCHLRSGHGLETLTQGLENSCNPFFITIGQKMGAHNFFKYFDAFGFTEKTGIDLPGEAGGSPTQYYSEDKYGIVELSSASFGQTNNISPIQNCTALCAIANGGTLVKPYIVSEIQDSDGNTLSKTEKTELRQVISEETSKTVLQMMKSVVDNGTGKNGKVAGYSVGGKTGTSTKLGEFKEGEKTKYIVSFSAIAPVEDPQIAMIIICDEPNQDLGGGAICAPIAAAVVEEAMAQLGVEPTYTDKELAELSASAPSVVGMETSKAEATLEANGFKVKIVGNGSAVNAQSPAAAVSIPKGGTVVIYTESDSQQTVTVPDFSGMTISEANRIAAANNLNIEISGNNSSNANIVAYKQSEEAGTAVEIGTVIKVTFKSKQAALD